MRHYQRFGSVSVTRNAVTIKDVIQSTFACAQCKLRDESIMIKQVGGMDSSIAEPVQSVAKYSL